MIYNFIKKISNNFLSLFNLRLNKITYLMTLTII